MASDAAKRFLCIVILIGVLVLLCIGRLFDLQVVNGERYREQAQQRLLRAYPVKAPRGEIVDRNGESLVANRLAYYVQIQKVDMDDDTLNDIICRVTKLTREFGGEINTTFPIVYNEEEKQPEYQFEIDETAVAKAYLEEQSKEQNYPESTQGGMNFEDVEGTPEPDIDDEEADEETDEEPHKITEEEVDAAQENSEVQKLIADKKDSMMTAWEEENELKEFSTLRQIFEYYKNKYSVSGKYSESEAADIIAVRYEMTQKAFSATNPFAIATDVDENVVQQVKEQSFDLPGVSVEIETMRTYPGGKMAAHILGRTGKIFAEEYATLKDEGYGMNDSIGKDGLEKVLEKYLKGKDGYKSIELSKAGGVTRILQNQPPKSGKYAMLTIDAELQRAMEKSLEGNITAAVNRNGSGAAIAINPKTGEVLAMASYPSYDPSEFSEEYDKLLNNKSKPLLNKALNGIYSPGSTFKMLSAIAGLETGVITRYTTIVDKGKYTYYPSYQPTCLVYSSSGETHGTINVSEAIGVSCNYFFYELGRLTTIEKIDEYCEKFGLGEKTGIELSESVGRVAGPKEREEAGGIWYPGDTLQAAIGQSDNLFTPAQLASYVATMLNKGTRYSLHLLNCVKDYDTGKVVYEQKPVVLSKTPISDDTYEAVKDGMRRVVREGTARGVFSDCKYAAAGKTGTAEVPGGADNVLFTGFAPYDDPQIVVAVVIEHGANSRFAAQVARDVFDAYMDLGKNKDKKKDKKESDEIPEEASENNENSQENDEDYDALPVDNSKYYYDDETTDDDED